MLSAKFELVTPNAGSLMQSLRAFGYDIGTAIADLIDNSITAGASNISINFEWNNGNPWISVVDDGTGMNEYDLVEAMKPGSKNPLDKRKNDDLGRFGLGLKTASFSQCKRVTVITKKKSDLIYLRCWDLDLINQENSWILLKEGSEVATLLAEKYFTDENPGTIVLWESLDRIVPDEYVENEDYQRAFLNYARTVKEHISIVFSGFMSGKKKIVFKVNESIVYNWDPFMSENLLTTRMPQESLYLKNEEIVVRAYILPHQTKLTVDEFNNNAGPNGWLQQQGFYIYRNNRLIVMGNWLLPGFEKKEHYRLARIRIDINNKTDEEWSIDVRKSIAVPPISIQKELKRIAISAQRESARIYRHRGKVLARSAKKEKTFVWHQNLRSGKLGYKINRDHPIIKSLLKSDLKKGISYLLALIEETLPLPMIISDYSEKPDEILGPYEGRNIDDYDEMIDTMYKMYIELGYSSKEAISSIINTEPYIYAPEKVQIYCEKENIKIV